MEGRPAEPGFERQGKSTAYVAIGNKFFVAAMCVSLVANVKALWPSHAHTVCMSQYLVVLANGHSNSINNVSCKVCAVHTITMNETFF